MLVSTASPKMKSCSFFKRFLFLFIWLILLFYFYIFFHFFSSNVYFFFSFGFIILYIIYPLCLFLDIVSYLNFVYLFLIAILVPSPTIRFALYFTLIHPPLFLIPFLFILSYSCDSHFLILPVVSIIDFFFLFPYFYWVWGWRNGSPFGMRNWRTAIESQLALLYLLARKFSWESYEYISPPQAMWNKGYTVEND